MKSAPGHRAPGLHLLYVIDSIDASGGAEQSLATVAPLYRNLGIQLDVAYLHERAGLHAELLAAGACLFSLAGRGGRGAWVRRARSLIRERRPDLVHTTLFEADIAGRIAARLARTPVVSSLVNVSYGPEHRADPRVPSWKLRGAQVLDAATARLAARLHAVSGYVAESMAHRLRFPRSRIDVVPRGRSAQELGVRSAARRAAARSTLGASETQPILVTVARQEHQKGLDVLLRAMPVVLARYPTARLLVAGREGNETAVLRDLVQAGQLSGSVSFLGPRRDVPELLCAADVFVLASRREGFPGSVLEAMALEIPIVASDIPPVRDAVDTSCAILTEVEAVPDLAAAIAGVLSDPSNAAIRAHRARERFEREFTAEAVAAAMFAFYQRALGWDS